MTCKVIVDPGSCFENDLDRAKELTLVAQACGADAIKWQLFHHAALSPNNYLPLEWFKILVDYGEHIGIEVFASVWYLDALMAVKNAGCHSIKFSYGHAADDPLVLQALSTVQFSHVYMSGDINTVWPKGSPKIIRLFCISKYPVYEMIMAEELYPTRFAGFSDHSLGIQQAAYHMSKGATVVEKHFDLADGKSRCPDSRFAIHPYDLELLCKGRQWWPVNSKAWQIKNW